MQDERGTGLLLATAGGPAHLAAGLQNSRLQKASKTAVAGLAGNPHPRTFSCRLTGRQSEAAAERASATQADTSSIYFTSTCGGHEEGKASSVRGGV